MTIVHILGALAGLFGALLIVLPALRVARGELEARRAIGLWISGAGFVLLALAAFVLRGEAAHAAVLAGVTAAVAGNIVQRHLTKSPL
jgi:multidrug transporter EmrE-like cation transporter